MPTKPKKSDVVKVVGVIKKDIKAVSNKREDRKNKRIDRKYEKVESKIAKAKGTKREGKVTKKYGYDYKSAISAGLRPDETNHWPSRNPETGQILKGRRHPTISRTKKAERSMGYKITRKKGTLYSNPKKK